MRLYTIIIVSVSFIALMVLLLAAILYVAHDSNELLDELNKKK